MTKKEKEIFYKKLALWLDDWEIDQQFQTEKQDVLDDGKKHEIPYEEPFYRNVKPGDVLLLSNNLTPNEHGLNDPLFIAVLRLWEKEEDEEYFLWAPYSSLSQPATDKELKFDNTDDRLTVLSLWNAHTSTRDQLSESWFAGELKDQDRKDALGVFWYSLGMKDLTRKLEDKVGPKLYHDKDPRHEYLEKELKRTQIIREFSFQSLHSETEKDSDADDKIISFSVWQEEEHKERPKLVAADRKRRNRYLEFYSEELPLKLIFRSIPRHGQIIFELLTDDEKLKDQIDEFLIKIEGHENQELSFENGQCIQDASMDFLSISLQSPEGKILKLKRSDPVDE